MDKTRNTMFVSPDDVKGASYVNYNVDDSLVGPAIRETQDIHLQSIIGSNLYYRLQELVFAAIQGEEEDTIDTEGNELYKELLEDYVRPYMQQKTQAVLCLPVSLKLRSYGIEKNSDTNLQAAQLREVMAAQNRYNTMSAKYATRLSKYLCLHRDDFPELSESDCKCGVFQPPMIGKTFVETGLVLGNTKNGCKC